MNKRILSKLKKLSAHAESARSIGNDAEAKAFDEQIKLLLKKHNITIEQVAEHTLEVDEVGMEIVWNKPRKLEDWYFPLHSTIGLANECFGIYSNDGLAYIGFADDRKRAAHQMRYFESLFASKREAYGSAVNTVDCYVTGSSMTSVSFYFGGPDRGASYLHGLVQGFTAGILRDRTEEAWQKSQIQSEALAVSEHARLEKKAKRIKQFFDKRVPQQDANGERIAEPPQQVLVEMTSYEEGLRDGQRIKLSDLELDETDSFGEGLVKR